MAYQKKLADKVEESFQSTPGFESKMMFGGVGYLVHGNMACGVLNDSLIVRVGPDNYEAVLKSPSVKPFDITGRPMRGWVMISGSSIEGRDSLNNWIKKGVEFALSLPPKQK